MTTTSMSTPQIRVVMLPKDTNALGNIFGGVILSHLDLAAAEYARFLTKNQKFVTKVLREVNFIAPVYVGDTVSYFAETVCTGRTSITIKVRVEALRSNPTRGPLETVHVTQAEVVMVAIDKDGNPTPLCFDP